MKVQNKVIIVTGAGSGMGRELTIQLVSKGAIVAMADINQSGMEETRSMTDVDKVSIHQLDVTNRDKVDSFVYDVLQQHGVIDGIINNAGIIQPFVDVKDLDYDVIERIFNINFYGTLYLTKALIPHLLKRPIAHIANVSSMGGYIPFPGQTFYSASKAAVKILTEGLYAELKDTNIKVTVIHPGAVNTNIMKNSGVTAEGAPSSDDAANATLPASEAARIMIQGIEKDQFRVLVGKDAWFIDKFYRFSPKRAIDFIVKKMGGR